MTDEIQATPATTPEVSAEQTAPIEQATAAPQSVETPPETVEAKPEEQKPKTFTQEELDAKLQQRLAREQRKWQREQAQLIAELQARPPANVDQTQFETPEDYAKALAQPLAEQIAAQREQARRQAEVVEAFHDREEQAREKYDDFEQVAYNPNLPITDVMAQTIQASDIGPDVAYYLGSNPKEADRIARLSPFLQAKEIGRIEAKLAAEPPKSTKTSSAPQPIAPVTPRSTSTPSYDTTDPRSVKTMSASEWIAAERERQRRKFEAQRR